MLESLTHKSTARSPKMYETKISPRTELRQKQSSESDEGRVYSTQPFTSLRKLEIPEEGNTDQNLNYYKGALPMATILTTAVEEKILASLECEVTAVYEQVVHIRANSKGKPVDMVMDRLLLKEKELDQFGAYFKITVIEDEAGYTKTKLDPIAQGTIWRTMLPSDEQIDSLF